MARVLFITEQTLKDKSVLSENIDSKYIGTSIKKAQDKEIEPVLGTNLYNDIQDKVILSKTNPAALSDDYKNLLDNYIQDALVSYTVMHSQIELAYKFQNKGVLKKGDENNTAATFEEIREIINYFKNDAEWYKTRLIKYLEANPGKFPKYKEGNTEGDEFKPIKKAYSCPINTKI